MNALHFGDVARTHWLTEFNGSSTSILLFHEHGVDLLRGTLSLGRCGMHISLVRVEDVVIEERDRRIVIQRCASDNLDVCEVYDDACASNPGYMHTITLRPAGHDRDELYVALLYPFAE